jgi:hypothetical protein
VRTALGRVPIPASRVNIEPPNGRTLVNFATNFYTEREEFTRTVQQLGQRVELRITPAQFTWHFDDGESATTTTPGAPYPRLDVTHDYLESGEVSPSVDTTYTADFRGQRRRLAAGAGLRDDPRRGRRARRGGGAPDPGGLQLRHDRTQRARR